MGKKIQKIRPKIGRPNQATRSNSIGTTKKRDTNVTKKKKKEDCRNRMEALDPSGAEKRFNIENKW